MAVTNGWGQAAVNNTIDYGKGKTTATNNWGEIYDSSSSGDTNITGGGGAAPFTNTKSILLDGVDEFVTMGDVLDISNDGTQAFSFSCWFKTTDTATQVLIGKQLNTSPFNGYVISLKSNKINFFLGTTSANARVQGSSPTLSSITDNNWHHVAVTYDGSQAISGFKIYFDNISQSITTTFNNTPTGVASAAHFMLGARGTTSSKSLFLDGGLDEASYFTSELSASDVNTIYGTGVPNDISSLNPVGWWRCGDDDTSPTLTDNGSGGNNGTMTNFSTFSTDVPT